MIQVSFKPSFVRTVKTLDKDLRREVLERIELFKDSRNHKILKVHKLHGKLSDKWSFSVNYKIRVIFVWEKHNEAVLLAIGDHDVYR